MSEPLEKVRSPEERFVAFLYGLARSENRGALAALRRGLGRMPDAQMLRLVVPHLPQGDGQTWKHEWYYLVASLFALWPETGGSGDMGDVFRRIGDNESSEKRFVALLDSRAEDLPHRLRQAVSLAKSKGVPIGWLRLLQDLLFWNDEKRRAQNRWARSHWGRRAEVEAPSSDTQTADSGA